MGANEISEEFEELLDKAKQEFTFDDPFDKELFCKMMKLCYEYFFTKRDKKQPFNRDEIELYGMVYAYSQIPNVTEGENSRMFEISTKIADDVATLILDSEFIELKDATLVMEYAIDEKTLIKINYNFNTGDFGDYIKFDQEYGL